MRIGLLLTGDSNWMGGVYYVLNIARTLSRNESVDTVIVFYSMKVPTEIINELSGLKSIVMVKLFDNSLFEKAVNWFCRRVLKWNWWLSRLIDDQKADVIYPLFQWDPTLKTKAKQLFWIYDFQHVHLPEYFSEKEIEKRNKNFQLLADHADHIVLSSADAKGHFEKLYPNSRSQTHVLHFSSVVEQNELQNEHEIREKYSLKDPYFIVCNQFWKHKNHSVVVDAMVQLISEGFEFDVVFTGKLDDPNHPEYVNDLLKKVEGSNISNAHFLGFIDRTDQLTLMKYSQAVIQPSRFEGWGTVVEDAKALGVAVIASNIPVHKEQIEKDALFFELDDATQLSTHMKKRLDSKIIHEKVTASDETGRQLLYIFKNTLKN